MTTVQPDQAIQTDPALSVVPYGEDEIFVRRGSRSPYSRLIRDTARRRLLSRLVSQLVEPASLDELRRRFDGREGDVDDIVQMLETEGVVSRRPAAPPAVRRVRLLGAGRTADTLTDILSGRSDVEVVSAGVPPEELLDADLDDLLDGIDLAIVAPDGLRPGLSHAVNEATALTGTSWLNVAADGGELLIGPVVLPGETACYTCYEITDEAGRRHRNDFLVYKDALDAAGFHPAVPAPQAHLAAAWAALAVTQLVETGRCFLTERVLRVDTERMEVIGQRVLQLPRCPVCSRCRPDLRHTFL